MKKLPILSVLLIAGIAFAVQNQKSPESKFAARLLGDQEVPRVTTKAYGEAKVWIDQANTRIRYKLNVTDLKNVTGAHLHLGPLGKNGPPIAMLWDGPQKKGMFSGVLSDGILKPQGFVGPLKGKPLSDFVSDLRAGKLYVNVHTKAHPDGELRGQLH
jgi:hypothetical protein